MHYVARPVILDGAEDPVTDRSGFYRAGGGVEVVNVPDDLKDRDREIAVNRRLEWPPESGPPTGIDYPSNWRISDGWKTRKTRRYCIEASAG